VLFFAIRQVPRDYGWQASHEVFLRLRDSSLRPHNA
jgi:hypothetical protein